MSEERKESKPLEPADSDAETREQVPVEPEPLWSAPTALMPTLTEVDLEPLQPLEPSLGQAIADSYEPMAPSFDFDEEMPRAPLSRPLTPITNQACPHGRVGNCVWCSLYPCGYMLERALRYLLVRTKAGG